MTSACPRCGGNDALYCESRGETYCTACGFVLEENRMVDTVTFAETSSGAVRAVGQFIPTSGFTMSYGSREIRELTLQRGYTNIQRIADRLRLPMSLIEAAQRVYLMGVQRGFTAGRINQHVAAACLYISCRRDKSPQMLIDFSDVLMAPVKVLGRMFVKMLRVLRIHVPTIDPSLFMERFASQMDLADKSHDVAQTGVRLVQAMTRDWIATGRRPTGLCGAALLIAARYHGFRINPEDISSIIRLASSTISKRLSEFQKTATAQLKQSEFETTDLLSLPILTEPPCVVARKIRIARQALPAGEEPDAATPSQVIYAIEGPKDSNATTLADGSPRLHGRVQLHATSEEICNEMPTGPALSGLAHRMIHAIQEQIPSPTSQQSHEDVSTESTCILGGSLKEKETTVAHDPLVPSVTDEMAPLDSDPLGELLAAVKEKASALVTMETTTEELDNGFNGTAVTSAAVQRVPLEGEAALQPVTVEDEETLSDVSDSEINAMLLTEEERQAKALIWDELMKDVMPEVERRYRERRRREQDPGKSSRKPRKRLKALEAEPAATAADSVRAAFELKSPALARRLDDDALESLFRGDGKRQGTRNDPIASSKTLSPPSALDSLFA